MKEKEGYEITLMEFHIRLLMLLTRFIFNRLKIKNIKNKNLLK